jgi:hypothetical protein
MNRKWPGQRSPLEYRFEKLLSLVGRNPGKFDEPDWQIYLAAKDFYYREHSVKNGTGDL